MTFLAGTDRTETISGKTLDMTVEAEHPVRIMDAFLHAIVPESFGYRRARVNTETKDGYDPMDLLGLYIYGYVNQAECTLGLESVCQTEPAVRWLMRGLTPDVKTLIRYRMEKPKALRKALEEFQRFVKGEATAKYYTEDEGREMSEKGMEALKEQIDEQTLTPEEYLQKLDETDERAIEKKRAGRRKKTWGLAGKSEEELRALAAQGYYVKDAVKDRVYCPRGIILRRKSVKKDGTIRYSNKLECRRCEQREKCTVAPFKIVEFRDGQEYSLCKKWNEREDA